MSGGPDSECPAGHSRSHRGDNVESLVGFVDLVPILDTYGEVILGKGTKMAKRKSYSEEFKREAVRLLVTRGERPVAEVAKGLGVMRVSSTSGSSATRTWRRLRSTVAVKRKTMARLRREVSVLRKEREILKRSILHSMGRDNTNLRKRVDEIDDEEKGDLLGNLT